MQDLWNSLMDLLLHDRSNEGVFIFVLIMGGIGYLIISGRLRTGPGGAGGDGGDGGGCGGGGGDG